MTTCAVCGLDGGNSLSMKANADKITKLEHEVHELNRTRYEAEAAAHVEGYKQGRRDCQKAIRSLIGVE